jgi:hypothetical protein
MTHTVFICMSPFSTTVFLILNVDNYLPRFLKLHNKNYQASRTFTSLSHKRFSSFYRLLVQLLLLPSLSYYKMHTPNNSFVFYGQCTTFCISGSLLWSMTLTKHLWSYFWGKHMTVLPSHHGRGLHDGTRHVCKHGEGQCSDQSYRNR